MIQIRTLGHPGVLGPGGDVRVGRKEFALLVYLARHSPRAVSREELATLLWDQRQDTQARQSLRQALVRLKRAIDVPIEVHGDAVTLLRGAWVFDVAAFEADCGAGKWREAVARWDGDFLLRMEDAGGESYRAWLESEREAARRRAGHAFECLVAEAEQAGDWPAAVEWAERGAAAQPFAERAQRRLIEILRLAGRSDEALARHAAFAGRVKREQDAALSADFERLGIELAKEGRASRPGEPKPGSRALFTPDLVGRATAFTALSAAWATARSGTAVAVLVEGEEGIGKTRLCDEFVRSLGPARPAPLVLRARGYEAGRDVAWALARELLSPLKDAPGLLGAPHGALAGIGRLVPALRERFPLEPAEGQGEWGVEEAVAEVLAAVAAETPIVLLVDDLAVGDSDSQRLVLALARRLHGDRVLLLLAARAQDLERAAELAGLRIGRDLQRLRLNPLSQPEVEALVASMLDLPLEERRALAARLYQEAGGLPLFIVETVAALVDEGHVAPDPGGQWRAGTAVRDGPLPLPTGVREAVARRLAFMSAAARRLADAAAVLTMPAERDLLRVVSGLPPIEFDAALEELLARHLLRGPAEAYAFVHEASRRATYDVVPTARRRELHAAALGALRLHRDVSESSEAILRYHRARAGTAAWPLPRWARSRGAALALGTVAVLGGLTLILNWPTGIGFRDRDWVVISQVQNQTGDSLFDPSLAAALSVGLSQSRYVNVYPPERVRETLRRMGRDTVSELDEGLAREVARREGLRAVVALAIARSDTGYVVTARIVDPGSGADLATLSARAASDRVLYALDDVSRQLRRRMGESLRAVQQHSVPLPHASTTSLEALQRFAEGREAYVAGRWQEAEALWQEAIALDSTFAWAHASLGRLYYFLNNPEEGDRHFRVALNLLGRLPERERLWIRQLAAKGDEGVRLARDFVREYPDDRDGWFSAGRRLQDAGKVEEAVAAYARVLAIDSHHLPSLLNTAVCYDALDRPREAVAAFERAFAITPIWVNDVGGDINRIYGFSYLRVGDSARARTIFQRLLTGGAGHQASGHRSLALYEMYYGRYDRAIAHLREAVRAAPSGITEYRNRLYLAAAYRTKEQAASADVQLATADEIQRRTRIPVGFLAFLGQRLARDGRLADAARVLDSMTARMDPTLDRGPVELVRGEIALAKGDVATALEALDLAATLTPYSYVRSALARARVVAGQWDGAEKTYQTILHDSTIGWEVQEPWIVAPYELGRLYESRGDTANAIAFYEPFVHRWAAGDEDLAVLADARNRLRMLGRRVEAHR